MKAVIVGAEGQLGRELERCCPAHYSCVAASRAQLDITVLESVRSFFLAHQPQLIINCAAYTAVDGAESNPDLAIAINADGVANLAKAATQISARVVHISTDFIFDGEAKEPYGVDAKPRPLGVYGHSKLAGEMRLQEILPLDSAIVRTSWLYSAFGSNFVKTMLRLMNERSELRVVADQVGAPTWARGLAVALWGLADQPQAHGIYHWTDAGSCSWYDFAGAIYRHGRSMGLVDNELQIEAIGTEDYPTPAARPAYSVLDCRRLEGVLGYQREAWELQLQHMLKELKDND
jgi:dTDP-4-dehydrorhamnose reductase